MDDTCRNMDSEKSKTINKVPNSITCSLSTSLKKITEWLAKASFYPDVARTLLMELHRVLSTSLHNAKNPLSGIFLLCWLMWIRMDNNTFGDHLHHGSYSTKPNIIYHIYREISKIKQIVH